MAPPRHRGAGGSTAAQQLASADTLRALRKSRQRPAWISALFVLLGSTSVASACWLVSWLLQPGEPPLQQLPDYKEALRVLSNDGLNASEENVRLAIRLLTLAKSEQIDSSGYKLVAPDKYWPPAEKQFIAEGHAMTVRPLAKPPGTGNVLILENFTSASEANSVLDLAQNRWKPSNCGVQGEDTSGICADGFRTSQSTYFHKDEQDVLLQRLVDRAVALIAGGLVTGGEETGINSTSVEAVQVARYEVGQRYKPHFDTDGPNHRWWTVLIYLNSMEATDGGQTRFPMLELGVQPRQGQAVFFDHIVDGKRRIYHALHDAEPVLHGTKYVMQLWLHNPKFATNDGIHSVSR